MTQIQGFAKLTSPHGGADKTMVWGTVGIIGDAGSFAITLAPAGSVVMRNIQSVVVTQLGTVAAIPQATGSSSGYITVDINRLGSFVLATPGGSIVLNFIAIAGGGSV